MLYKYKIFFVCKNSVLTFNFQIISCIFHDLWLYLAHSVVRNQIVIKKKTESFLTTSPAVETPRGASSNLTLEHSTEQPT